MSDHLDNASTPEAEFFESGRFAGLSVLLGVVAFVALALCGAGAAIDPKQFSFSWLFAFGFFFTLCAGCFFWTIVHYATDASWTVVVRRQLENIAVLVAVLAIFFIPIVLLRQHLYEWMNIAPGKEANLDSKRAYLNLNFFILRAAFFLGFFIPPYVISAKHKPKVLSLKLRHGKSGSGPTLDSGAPQPQRLVKIDYSTCFVPVLDIGP